MAIFEEPNHYGLTYPYVGWCDFDSICLDNGVYFVEIYLKCTSNTKLICTRFYQEND